MTQRQPRVTFVVSGLTPTLGLERVTLNLISALEPDFDIQVIAIGGSLSDKELFGNIRILGAPLTGWQRIRSLGRLYPHTRRKDLGTVILVGVWTAIPWLVVAPLTRARTIVWEHTLLKEKLQQSQALRILKALTKLIYRRADCVVAVSDPVADDIAEYKHIKQVAVIPNIVETPASDEVRTLTETRKRTTDRILCVGSLTPVKSQHLALEALALLGAEYSLRLIGSGPRKSELVQLAENLGISNRVEFAGYLNRESVRDELSRASILLHCSVAETFGLVYAEAADAGLPVVSVNTRVARLMIPSYAPGWLTEPTAEAIADTIRDLPRREAFLTEDFLAAARLRRADFGINSVRAKWIRILKDRSAAMTGEASAGVIEEAR